MTTAPHPPRAIIVGASSGIGAAAARQIVAAIGRKRSHAYVTRRWRIVAWLLRILPDTW
jgi:NAD(P)-dependent dehydrogenase (short-subunit alcohol dehydrogenase family)